VSHPSGLTLKDSHLLGAFFLMEWGYFWILEILLSYPIPKKVTLEINIYKLGRKGWERTGVLSLSCFFCFFFNIISLFFFR